MELDTRSEDGLSFCGLVAKYFIGQCRSDSCNYGYREKHHTLADKHIFLQTTFAKVTNKVYTKRT